MCRNSGMKLTHQRMQIFREVAQTGGHPDAEKVFQGVRERMPTMSLDTVYRTLWMLKDLGLITTLGPPRERNRFDANLSHHHHFVCVRCGLTRDFYSDAFDELKLPNSVKAFGRVETTQIELKGVCLKCNDEAKSQTKKFKKKEEAL
ncbi:Fur family transcriptional regulator [Thermodesulfobacteriota bacterium]